MAYKDEDHLVQCPYYKHDTSQVIFCEGLEDGMVIHLAFDTHPRLINYKGRYCRRCNWPNCPLASMHNARYEYE